ncbi:hypothetical protein LZU96_11205 [Pantoea agglomerans]|nr:hypothetical protein [Pantoea agglomerans]UIL50836.1 hypothetical protein LZU96_11205 [Pantoea agglomerans]
MAGLLLSDWFAVFGDALVQRMFRRIGFESATGSNNGTTNGCHKRQ